MSLRGRFIAVFVTFSVGLTAAVGFLSWREASRALEAELDRTAEWVAGAAVATGLQASAVVALRPGLEDEFLYTGTRARLQRLLFVVSEAYILRDDNTAIVSNFPPDSIPIGAYLPQFDAYGPELAAARTTGYATTPSFTYEDRRYKWAFAELEQSDIVLAVLMPAEYEVGLAALRRNLFAISLMAAVLAAGLAALLAAGVIEPIERLSRVALRIQRGHMDEPVAEERDDELGRLSRAMERMRQGILERDERLRLMLAQVAHEIRNPLGGLELFASAAAEADEPAERARLLRRVRDEVTALNGTINDFLTFARPVEPSREPSDLREPLLQAVDLVEAELGERGGRLEVELPDEPLIARVAPEHAKRVALNLLRNAAQASDHVRLRAALLGGEICLVVTDRGPGVPDALRERVFDPFVTDKEQGAGLGLAIVKKLAEANGGRVELAPVGETDGGRGAEFRVYFGSLEDPPRVAES